MYHFILKELQKLRSAVKPAMKHVGVQFNYLVPMSGVWIIMFRAFWQFAQFRNCIVHSVNCQIACQFLNCVRNFEIVQRFYTAQFRNEGFWARCAPVLDTLHGKLLIHALYSCFQLASCILIIIALRWTPRVLNTKLNVGSCCSAMMGGARLHLSV